MIVLPTVGENIVTKIVLLCTNCMSIARTADASLVFGFASNCLITFFPFLANATPIDIL